MRVLRLAVWWLTRELEAGSAKVCHVDIFELRKVARWNLPASKTDQAALGCWREHGCTCQGAIGVDMCPYHLMKTQVGFVRRKFGSCPNTPLFPTSSGAHFTKIDFVRLVELAASHLGHPLEADNRHLFGGHSARVSGAQWLVRRGMEIWRVQVLGRWGSSAVLAYIRDVPASSSSCFAPQLSQRLSLENVVTQISELAHRVSSAEGVADSAVYVARESGLKEVDVRSIY